MANYLVNDTQLTSVANAIRAKSGGSTGLAFPDGFVTEIGNIPSGGGGNEAWRGIYNSAISEPFSVTDLSCTKINGYAFYSCRNITAANFPLCLSVSTSAFASCRSLTVASFPLCTYLAEYAFENCYDLTTISFPLCTYIGYAAFSRCLSLTTVNFPSCSFIGSYGFASCYSLTTVSFPSCMYIGEWAFISCTNLTAASFSLCSFVGPSAFRRCDNLSIVDLPMCESISASAFHSCSNLTTVNFAKCSIIKGSLAFGGCRILLSLYLMSTDVCTLSNSNAFGSTPIAGYTDYTGGVYGSIFVPASLVSAYQTASNWSYYSERFVGVE